MKRNTKKRQRRLHKETGVSRLKETIAQDRKQVGHNDPATTQKRRTPLTEV